MPSEGIYQQPAGLKKPCGCSTGCMCDIPKSKTMKTDGVKISPCKDFTIEAPEYKGNAALNAQKS